MSDVPSLSGNTLTALFDRRAEAERATARLRDIGVFDTHIRLTEGAAHTADAGGAEHGDATEPASKGFFEALGDFFFPEDDRQAYAEGLSRGGFLVTVVDVRTELQAEVLDVLEEEGAVNIDEREAAWRSEGWSGALAAQSDRGRQDHSQGHPRPDQPGFADAAPGQVPEPAEFPKDRSRDADDRTGLTQPSGRFAEELRELPEQSDEAPRVESTEPESAPLNEAEAARPVSKRDTSHGRARARSYVRE